MRVLVLGLILTIAVTLAGCGGGGGAGGGSATASLTKVPSDIVGTWRVPGLGLPDDKLGVRSDGGVIINTQLSGTRGDSQTRIGTCSPEGSLDLNGSWRASGVDYFINASGRVQPQSHSLTMQATVVASSGAKHENQVVSGDKISGLELPPPPPGDPPADDLEKPPPPPGDDPSGTGLPPPPPF